MIPHEFRRQLGAMGPSSDPPCPAANDPLVAQYAVRAQAAVPLHVAHTRDLSKDEGPPHRPRGSFQFITSLAAGSRTLPSVGS